MSEKFTEVADKALGLAVSVFTLCSESPERHDDRTMIARELIADHGDDPRYAGQALSFVCKLLTRYMTPEQVLAEKDALIERVLGKDRNA